MQGVMPFLRRTSKTLPGSFAEMSLASRVVSVNQLDPGQQGKKKAPTRLGRIGAWVPSRGEGALTTVLPELRALGLYSQRSPLANQ